MTMNRIELFNTAKRDCEQLEARYPECRALQSIKAQLDYLISLESGSNKDRSRIKDIIIGVLAAREIEPRDIALAELL